MALEKEYLAMRQIDRAIASLKDPEDRARIIKWAFDKHSRPTDILCDDVAVKSQQHYNRMGLPIPAHA